ncbi:MAG: DUF5668 domain-containing protein [Chloroflexota bacterium]
MDDLQESRRHENGRSLFGPIFLIGLGTYFLLRNLGYVSDLNWGLALQMWPLLLIFLGLNIIVRQVKRPLGTLLSGVVSVAAIGLFGAVLLFGLELPFLASLNLQPAAEYREETVSVPGAEVASATVSLDLGALGADVTGLAGGQNVLEGTLSLAGDLDFRQRMQGSEAIISLGENPSGWWFGDLVSGMGQPPWQIGLSRTVPLDLTVDVGSGQADLALDSLVLSDLVVDVGSGAVTVQLPGGVYDVRLDGGSGHVEMTLPGNGRHEIEIDAGSGAMDLLLPPNMAARVELDSGSGQVSLDERFDRVSGDGEDGVWETPNYDPEGDNSILIILDGSSGAISIEQPTGR